MNLRCKNCGGNVVYNPAEKRMICPFCDGADTEEFVGDRSITVCPNCGGEINVSEVTSASRCQFCNTYLIFDDRIDGEYKPDVILPFKISKEMAVDYMEKEFKKRKFAPASFLSEKTLVDMNGYYVPFFLYDFRVQNELNCEGIKIHKYTRGNYEYTETSYYEVGRKLYANYDNIPADASTEMDDSVMDLIEPYMYEELIKFEPKFMSGFYGEIYNAPASEYEDRARKKAKDSAAQIMKASLSEYSSLRHEHTEENITQGSIEYALMPVWVYSYQFGNKIYNYYVNGQTGKVVGTTPVSMKKVISYGCTFAACMLAIFECIAKILEVL